MPPGRAPLRAHAIVRTRGAGGRPRDNPATAATEEIAMTRLPLICATALLVAASPALPMSP